MGKDDLPGILRNSGRPKESRWQRYWRKRRMRALRNSSDHATAMAIGILFIVLLISALLVIAAKRGGLSSFRSPKGIESLKPPGH